jgi:hypothetical protein
MSSAPLGKGRKNDGDIELVFLEQVSHEICHCQDDVGFETLLHQALGQEEPLGVDLRTPKPADAAERQVDIGEDHLTPAPAMRRLTKVDERSRLRRPQVRGGQERLESPLIRRKRNLPARSIRRGQDGSSAHHQALAGKPHHRLDCRSGPPRPPFLPQLFR